MEHPTPTSGLLALPVHHYGEHVLDGGSPLILKKASANVLGAPVCTVRLRRLPCCGCSVVSRSQEAMNQNRGRHRVMPIAGGTGNPQQRTQLVRRSLHISIIFGVVERLVGLGLVRLGGESRYTGACSTIFSPSHGPTCTCCQWLRGRMPRSHVLSPFHTFLCEPQLAETVTTGESNALCCHCSCCYNNCPFRRPLAKQVGDSTYCAVSTAP